MGCTCLFKNPEIDFNMAKDNKSLLRTKDGIKLKSGRKYKTGLFRTLSQSSLIEINNFRKEVLKNINKHRKEHTCCGGTGRRICGRGCRACGNKRVLRAGPV